MILMTAFSRVRYSMEPSRAPKPNKQRLWVQLSTPPPNDPFKVNHRQPGSKLTITLYLPDTSWNGAFTATHWVKPAMKS